MSVVGGPPGGPAPWATPPPVTPYPDAPVVDRPGAAGYWIGAIVMVLGVTGIIVVATVALTRAAELVRFPEAVDPSGAIVLDDAGGYVVFTITSVTGPAVSVTSPVLTVTGPDGRVIPTSPYEGSRMVTRPDPVTGAPRTAIAVATFRTDRPGTHHVTTLDPGPASAIGVGRGVSLDGRVVVLGGTSSGLAVLGGIIVVIVTAARRHRPAVPTGGAFVAAPGRTGPPLPGSPVGSPMYGPGPWGSLVGVPHPGAWPQHGRVPPPPPPPGAASGPIVPPHASWPGPGGSSGSRGGSDPGPGNAGHYG